MKAMREAIEFADEGVRDEVPVGALILDNKGDILGRSRNSSITNNDTLAHAEVSLLREIGRETLLSRGQSLTMIVTLEPCPMCAWAIRISGIGRVVFGAYSPDSGSAGSKLDLLRDRHQYRPVEVVGGVLEVECSTLLGKFFQKTRTL